jgi:putative membrane protein
MVAAMWIAAALAGLIHALFFCMESLWWTKPAVYRRFHSTEAQAQTTKNLAFNQGFYNLFLAAGVFGGFFLAETGHYRAGVILVAWNCLSMLAASVVLAASSPRMMRGALIQGLPPLVFLLGTAYMRFG